jgi:hypothetical protein
MGGSGATMGRAFEGGTDVGAGAVLGRHAAAVSVVVSAVKSARVACRMVRGR